MAVAHQMGVDRPEYSEAGEVFRQSDILQQGKIPGLIVGEGLHGAGRVVHGDKLLCRLNEVGAAGDAHAPGKAEVRHLPGLGEVDGLVFYPIKSHSALCPGRPVFGNPPNRQIDFVPLSLLLVKCDAVGRRRHQVDLGFVIALCGDIGQRHVGAGDQGCLVGGDGVRPGRGDIQVKHIVNDRQDLRPGHDVLGVEHTPGAMQIPLSQHGIDSGPKGGLYLSSI